MVEDSCTNEPSTSSALEKVHSATKAVEMSCNFMLYSETSSRNGRNGRNGRIEAIELVR
jgi:hypothetical protein